MLTDAQFFTYTTSSHTCSLGTVHSKKLGSCPSSDLGRALGECVRKQGPGAGGAHGYLDVAASRISQLLEL